MAVKVPRHPLDPAAAWPADDRQLLPGPVLFWATFMVLLAVLGPLLLPWATELQRVDEDFTQLLTPERIQQIVELIPEDWLSTGDMPGTAAENRNVYYQFLTTRIQASGQFVKEAQHARQSLI